MSQAKYMKKSWFIIGLVAVFSLGDVMQRRSSAMTAQEDEASARLGWKTDFAAAFGAARKEGKILFIDFTGSDWCPPCMRLEKEVFASPEFAKFAAKNLVLLRVDFPKTNALPPARQKANDELAQYFGIEGFPTMVLVSPRGVLLGTMGYSGGGSQEIIPKLEYLRREANRG
jgi:thiol:disulfide interchange protein